MLTANLKNNFVSTSKPNLLPNQTRKVLQLDLNSRTKEFNQIIEKIANFIPHETCTRFLICDVAGKDQYAHKDHIEIDALAPEYQKLDYIDITTLEQGKSRVHSTSRFCSDGDGRFVPTFSIVVYFNAFGSCNFPKANLNVKGKRGRIIMFQNYASDAHRPVADDMAIHHGTYEDGRYKRVMTMGILSNKNIDLNKPPETRGILYVPGPRGPRDIAHHHDYDSRTYDLEKKPRPRIPESAYGEGTLLDVSKIVKELNPDLSRLQDWNFEAVVRKKEYNKKRKQWTYRLQFTHNFVNLYSNIAEKYLLGHMMITQSELRQRACGNAEDEVLTYIALTSSLSIHPSESRGWICGCHLCKRCKFSKRKAQLDRVLRTLMPKEFCSPEKIAKDVLSGNTEKTKVWRPKINIYDPPDIKSELISTTKVWRPEINREKSERISTTKNVAEKRITLFFKPGRLGIVSDNWKEGNVFKVEANSQASKLGVKAGWKIVKVNSRPYSESVLENHIAGSKFYEILFCTNPTSTAPRTANTKGQGNEEKAVLDVLAEILDADLTAQHFWKI